MLDPIKIKADFPIFKFNRQLVYFDTAAMSLKPKSVIEAVRKYYQEYSANVFRGIYKLSEMATYEYENTRKKVAQFIGVNDEKEIVFVRNTTEAINLIAYSWGRVNLKKGDEIVTTIMEHHSNFVPWQILTQEVDAIFKVIDINNEGFLDLDWKNDDRLLKNLEKIINKKTKILTLTFISNTLGTINPIKKIIETAKKINPKIVTIVDAAQAVPHIKINVEELGCDFLVFSGQKMLGPTGIGVLWGKRKFLENMPPFLFGGEMIKEVYLEKTVFSDLPHKFEAGTPHIAGVIGLGAAIDYLNKIKMDKIQKHEKNLTQYALERLREIKDLIIYGPIDVNYRSGIITFNLKEVHAHDVAAILDQNNICVRSGHHCTMPLHKRLEVVASIRATFYIYNAKEDIDQLIIALEQVKKFFL